LGRRGRGISQERLAQLSGLDRTYVSGIERGERNPSLSNLLKLANALDIRLSGIALMAESLPASDDSPQPDTLAPGNLDA